MTSKLTVEQVQAEVGHFWSVLTSKSASEVEDLYTHESTVFSTTGTRTEPGRLSAVRREREYFHPQTTLRAETSPVEVHLISDTAAIAAYTFQFHASHAKIGIEKTTEEHVIHGRATQVFVLEADGKLRIVHEHLSVLHRI